VASRVERHDLEGLRKGRHDEQPHEVVQESTVHEDEWLSLACDLVEQIDVPYARNSHPYLLR
jgi:hypothetical protein